MVKKYFPYPISIQAFVIIDFISIHSDLGMVKSPSNLMIVFQMDKCTEHFKEYF